MLRKHKKLTHKELKQDPLVDFAVQAEAFLRAEWIKIVGTIGTVVVIVALALAIAGTREKGSVTALDAALTALNNDSPEAYDLLNAVVSRYGGSSRAADATMILANEYYTKSDYDNARKYYSHYLDKFGDDPIYTFNAYNGLAAVCESQDDFAGAAAMYEQYIDKNKNSAFLSMMYLNAGKAYFAAGDTTKARQFLNVVTEKYADSNYNQEATYFLGLMN